MSCQQRVCSENMISLPELFSPTLKKCIGAFAAGLIALCTSNAHAENQDVQVSLSQKGTWDSNPLLLTNNYDDILGSQTTPKISFKSKTPTLQLDTAAFVDENIFDDSSYNSTDFHGTAGLTKKVERWSAGISGNVNYDTTRTSELTNFDVNVGSVRHLGYSVAPQISFNPTQIDTISVSGSFAKSEYDSNSHTDYHTLSVSPSYTHGFTPLNSGIISFNAQTYQADKNSDAKVDSFGPSVGWLTSISPEFTARLMAGTQASKQTAANGVEGDWKWNSTFSAEVNYKDEQDTTNLAATRKQQPYSNGTETLLTSVSLSETHYVTPHLSINGSASYQYSDESSRASTSLDSLISADAGITYRATDQVDLTTSYRYKEEDFNNNDKNARENIAMIGLVFHTSLDSN